MSSSTPHDHQQQSGDPPFTGPGCERKAGGGGWPTGTSSNRDPRPELIASLHRKIPRVARLANSARALRYLNEIADKLLTYKANRRRPH